ncbi:MAG: universal stress protein [Flammeovirgaceae bacterium]|nr:universal stress protein [Flammeovirgaceae bacterium]
MDGIKILIPTDFSQQADFAWLLARRFGERASMEVHFLHVLQLPATVSFDGVGNMISDGEMDLQMYNQLRTLAQEKLNHISQLHHQVVTHLQIGPLTDTIVDFAEKNKFDLVLMGTKGAKGFKEKIAGSETQQVVRYSEVPVLSVTCDRSELAMKNILFIHDFEEKVTHDVKLLLFFSATIQR